VTPQHSTPETVFTLARERAGKVPAEVVTDGLPAYADAFGGSFRGGREGTAVIHTREIHISKPEKFPHNNKIERLNGTLRERQKVARGLKRPMGPLTRGHAMYYNLVRPHQALGGSTPAEAAGLSVEPAGSRWVGRIRAAAGARPAGRLP
jgi:Integrase core domain